MVRILLLFCLACETICIVLPPRLPIPPKNSNNTHYLLPHKHYAKMRLTEREKYAQLSVPARAQADALLTKLGAYHPEHHHLGINIFSSSIDANYYYSKNIFLHEYLQ